MVYISQVVTETDLLQRSHQLEQALENGQYVEYCAMKSANCTDPLQENIWNFLRVNFEKEPREHFIQLLGFDKTDLAKKVNSERFMQIVFIYIVLCIFHEADFVLRKLIKYYGWLHRFLSTWVSDRMLE